MIQVLASLVNENLRKKVSSIVWWWPKNDVLKNDDDDDDDDVENGKKDEDKDMNLLNIACVQEDWMGRVHSLYNMRLDTAIHQQQQQRPRPIGNPHITWSKCQ